MARTLYLYTDEQGTAHAVADWSKVPAQLRGRAKALSSQDAPRPAGPPPSSPIPRIGQAALAFLAVVAVWKVSKSFFVRAAAVVAFGFWLYIQAFNWFNILGSPSPAQDSSSGAESEGEATVTPAETGSN